MATKSVLRETLPATASPVVAAAEPPIPIERHYTATEVADLWRFNVETIRRLFNKEPGIVVVQGLATGRPSKGRKRRQYQTIRIPQTVLDRVHRRLQR